MRRRRWFRSALEIGELAERLRLEDEIDAENYWEWIIGTLMGERIDVTRTHTREPAETDTRVFLLDGGTFSEELLAELVARLRLLAAGPIRARRWVYRRDDDFDLVTVQEYAPARE